MSIEHLAFPYKSATRDFTHTPTVVTEEEMQNILTRLGRLEKAIEGHGLNDAEGFGGVIGIDTTSIGVETGV